MTQQCYVSTWVVVQRSFHLLCDWSFDRLLNYIVRGELIEIRDQNQALNYMTLSRVGMPIVWNYLDNSWTTVPST
jgi:hypothetical protein